MKKYSISIFGLKIWREHIAPLLETEIFPCPNRDGNNSPSLNRDGNCFPSLFRDGNVFPCLNRDGKISVSKFPSLFFNFLVVIKLKKISIQ